MKKNDLMLKYAIDKDEDKVDHLEAAVRLDEGPVIRENFPTSQKKAVDILVDRIKMTKKKSNANFGKDEIPYYMYEWKYKGKTLGKKLFRRDGDAEVWFSRNLKTTLYYVLANGKKQKSMNYAYAL